MDALPDSFQRNAELAHLTDLLRQSEKANGCIAVVTGVPGSGKTELLQQLGAVAKDHRFEVLEAVGGRSESDLPFGLVGQLLDDADLVPERRREVDDTLSHCASLTRPAISMIYNLCTVLLEAARDRMLCLLVDDLHYADGASIRCLHLLARRMRRAGIMLLLASSGRVTTDAAALHDELLGQPQVETVTLAPLDVAQITELAASRLGSGASTAFAAKALAVSGGLPRLVSAVVDDRAGGATEPGDGPAFAWAAAEVVQAHAPDVVRLACAAALLDEPVDDAAVRILVDMDVDAAARAVRELELGGLVVGGKPRHPAITRAMLAELCESDLRELRFTAAKALNGRSASVLAVARHLVALGDAPEPWMVRLLRDAAYEAEAMGEAGLAMACLGLVYRCSHDQRERSAVLVRLVGLEWMSSSLNTAQRAVHLSCALDEIRCGGPQATMMFRYLLRYGGVAEIGQGWRQLGRDARVNGTEAYRALTLLAGSVYPGIMADARDGTEHPEMPEPRTLESMLIAGPLSRACFALSEVLLRTATDETVDAAEEVLCSSQLSAESFEQIMAALRAVVYVDRLSFAEEAVDKLLQQAESADAVVWLAYLRVCRAEIALRRGDLTTAEAMARVALDSLPRPVWGVAFGEPLGVLLSVATAKGDFETSAQIIAAPVPDGLFSTRFGLRYLYARGEYHRARGHVHAALGDFLMCGQLMECWRMDVPGLVPWRIGAADAYLALGKDEKAWRLLDEQEKYLGDRHARCHAALLRLRAVGSAPSERLVLLRHAVEQAQKSGDQLELARAQAALGKVYQSAGEQKRAQMIFRLAIRLAEETGAWPLYEELSAAVAPERLGQDLGGEFDMEKTCGARLSEAERRVAMLAATGYTNREISTKLFITVSTVEQHLTRVYRKLEVRGRDDLAVEMQVERVEVGFTGSRSTT